jgi:hypothetical protein
MAGARTKGPICGNPNDYLAAEPTMTTENADAQETRGRVEQAMALVGNLEVREMCDETGRKIKGALWVKRDEVIEILMKALEG